MTTERTSDDGTNNAAMYLAIERGDTIHHIQLRPLEQLPSAFHLSVYAAFDLGECPHYTETVDDASLAQLHTPHKRHVIYPSNESKIPSNGLISGDFPVCVLNKGTDEFKSIDPDFESMIQSLRLGYLSETYLLSTRTPVSGRGNTQVSFGIACGLNVGIPTLKKDILQYNGVCIPRVLQNTANPDIVHANRTAWKIGRLVGIDYCQDDYLRRHPEHAPYFQIIKDYLGDSNMFASVTVAYLPLKAGHRVRRHRDVQNCPHMTASLCVAETVSVMGKTYRVCAIFTMRKTVSELHVRSLASGDLAAACQCFLDEKCNSNAMPVPCVHDPTDYVRHYYENHVGSAGIVVTVNIDTGRIEGLALRSKPSCDKQANFLWPVANSITALLESRPDATLNDIAAVLFVLGQLNGVYSLVTLLEWMRRDWDSQKSHCVPGGLSRYLLDRLVSMKGSICGGAAFRCQPFRGRTQLTPAKIIHGCTQIVNLMHSCSTTEQDNKKQLAATTVAYIKHHCKGIGHFSGQHVMHVAAYLGLLPPVLTCYASLNHTNITKNEAVCPNAAMYLGKEHIDPITADPQTARPGDVKLKCRSLLSSVTRFLQAKYDIPDMTEAATENSLCEGIRKMKIYDYYFAYQGIPRRVSNGTWKVFAPRRIRGQLTYTSRSMRSHHDRLTSERTTGWKYHCSAVMERNIDLKGGHSPPTHKELAIPLEFIDKCGANNLIPELRLAFAEPIDIPGESDASNNPRGPLIWEQLNRMDSLRAVVQRFQSETKVRQPKKRASRPTTPRPTTRRAATPRLCRKPAASLPCSPKKGTPSPRVVHGAPPPPSQKAKWLPPKVAQLPAGGGKDSHALGTTGKTAPWSPIPPPVQVGRSSLRFKDRAYAPNPNRVTWNEVRLSTAFHLPTNQHIASHLSPRRPSGTSAASTRCPPAPALTGTRDDPKRRKALVTKANVSWEIAYHTDHPGIPASSRDRSRQAPGKRPEPSGELNTANKRPRQSRDVDPPLPETPAALPLHSICTWKEHNGIKYRAYLTPDEARGFLYRHDVNMINCRRSMPTLCNDAHAALSGQIVSRPQRDAYPQIKKCKVDQSPVGKHLVVHRKTHPNPDGQPTVFYTAVLDRLPDIVTSSCMACGLIAKSLGGTPVKSRDGVQWYFETQDAAMSHVLLSVIVTAGTPRFYLGLANRTRKHAGVTGCGQSCTVGYSKEGSAREAPPVYYMWVTQGESPSVVMTFPLPRQSCNAPKGWNSFRLL